MTDGKARLAFRSGLHGAKDKMAFLIEARKGMPSSLFTEAIEWVSRQPKLAQALHKPFPKILGEIGAYSTYAPISAKRELSWLKAMVSLNQKKLQQYVELRNTAQLLTIKGDFTGADTILTSVNDQLGFSFWWLKHSLAIKQLAYGIEAHKKLSNELKNAFAARSITRYIIHQISVRNEPSVTPTRFANQIKDKVAVFPFTRDWKEKILYHINGHVSAESDGALHVLRHAYAESVIDSYEAFIYLAQTSYATSNSVLDKQHMLEAVQGVSQLIDDPRLISLLFVLTDGQEGSIILNEKMSSAGIFNSQNANHKVCFDIGQDILAATFENHIDPKIALSPANKYLSGVFSKKSETDFYAAELEKLSLTLPSFELIYLQKAIMKREMDSELVPLAIEHETIRERDLKFAFSTCVNFHLFLLKYLPNNLADAIETRLIDKNITSLTEAITGFQAGEVEPVYALESVYLTALRAFRDGQYEQISELASPLIHSNAPFYRFSAIRLIIHALLQEANVMAGIQLATSTYLTNGESVHVLPIRELADRLNKNIRRENKSDLSITILYDIYTRTVDGAYEGQLRQAVGAALFGNGITKPSELKAQANGFDHAKLVYFLRYTCLPEHIYMAGDYSKGTSSLLSERIAILNWLLELDPVNQSVYDEEIVEHTRRLVLEERRVEVEQSKIEYNLDGLVREAEKVVRENFDRYLAYVRAGIEEQPNKIATAGIPKSGSPLLPIALPINEVSDLLHTITEDLLDVFIKDRNYGMDGFLSTRIRHNELESEMLSSVVSLRLITTRNSDEEYKFNDHWLGDLYESDSSIALQLQGFLDEFAKNYDALIKEINGEWVRIRKSSNEQGLIEIKLNDEHYEIIGNILKERNFTFDEFAGMLFHTFFSFMENGLELIRNRLQQEAKQRALGLIDALEAHLLAAEVHLDPLLNSVRELHVLLPRSIDKVASWFKPSTENSSEPLRFDYVLQITVDMAKHYNPMFSAAIEFGNTEDYKVKGHYINAFTGIFMILFQNVIRRAGLGDTPHVQVYCSIQEDFIKCRFTNKIGADIDVDIIVNKAEAILNECTDGTYWDRVHRESGTGLYKIYDTLKHVMKIEPDLKIQVSPQRVFEVSFNLPVII
ncbi:hypothetical protein SAMN04488069_1222 [Hymenobacter psychrophilus]|uniref:Uncharacterized protein n=2 Tax=Hymenobacter psychrophilus TaxID=651662 RepID=A0A1H3P4T3_9BACT|nr:hypothetical protein SAMN04488069_1222 [Hymenobacter psychrophilus]